MLKILWNTLLTPLRWLLALVILFEEWGWKPLARALGRLLRHAGVRRVERRIEGLGPRVAFAVLFVPALLLLPVKLGALWLVGLGRVVIGLLVLICAKILGTAVVARLFILTRPQLMRVLWFAHAYTRWVACKRRVVANLVETPGWRAARSLAARVRAAWAAR